MSDKEAFSLDDEGRTAVIERFDRWRNDRRIDNPKGRDVVRFCADMWVARKFPGDLGIPAVWGILKSVGAFKSKR